MDVPIAIKYFLELHYPVAFGSGFTKINNTDDERTHKYQFDAAGGMPRHAPDCWCGWNKKEESSVKGPEPKNNDGRDKCYWCGGKTVTKPLATSFYQICERCGQ